MEEIEYPDWTIDRGCVLQKLENIAKDYIHYFTYQARYYQPMVVIWSRDELLKGLQGQQYRLITDWDNKQIKLMTAVPLNVDRNPFMRERTAKNEYAPTYLELVTMASCDSLPMNCDLVIDWGALGLLEELEALSTDPSLPTAEYLKYCLKTYYSLN